MLTVATEETDGFKRFIRSAKVYDIDVQVLGQGEKWEGGDMNFEGGGQKVNLLKAKVDELMKTKENDHIVLFTDRFVPVTIELDIIGLDLLIVTLLNFFYLYHTHTHR